MLVRRHLEADDLARRNVDDHALDHGDVFVADEGVTPGFDLRVAVGHRQEGHGARLALILLEGGKVFRVR